MELNIKTIYLISLLFLSNCGQEQNKEPFSIYVFESRYNETGKQSIKNNELLKNIDLIGGYMIDPGKKGTIDLESILTYLTRIYPNVNDTGTLCLNIENQYYRNLKKYKYGTPEFNKAIQEMTKMVESVKNARPKIKVGIYGLPFRFYYPSQKTWNTSGKLDSLLSKTDYIFPSLYVLYPDKQRTQIANNKYWKGNLDQAFDYGDRLKKPVIPFVWYIVSTGNKKYGGELLGKSEMKRYLRYIKEYKSEANNGVTGIIWWESSNKFFTGNVKQASHLNENIELNNSNILEIYINHFMSR